MPVTGGDERRVTEDGLFRYNYVVTSSAIYFMTLPRNDARATLKRIDLPTGRVTSLLTIDRPPDLGLALSPDSRYLLFTKVDYSGSDLMLVENFR